MWEDPEVCQVWTVKQENQNDWPRKSEEMPHKAIQTTRRMPLKDLLSLWVHPCLSRVVPFSLLINTLLASLFSLFVGILSCKAGWGPCHPSHWPVATIGAFATAASPISAGNPSPAPSPAGREPTLDQHLVKIVLRLVNKNTSMKWEESMFKEHRSKDILRTWCLHNTLLQNY